VDSRQPECEQKNAIAAGPSSVTLLERGPFLVKWQFLCRLFSLHFVSGPAWARYANPLGMHHESTRVSHPCIALVNHYLAYRFSYCYRHSTALATQSLSWEPAGDKSTFFLSIDTGTGGDDDDGGGDDECTCCWCWC
jgi:hypothetical protein